ncbi:helix-turn-helix transcriptional regulator [Actinocrispum wychmicini]|uniref:Regulatory LuxR family protein n=1 Tax=Actinocrispum wychmicini TaxID=1213861 RepID=A0A4R2JYK7_9PSEU|nr:LuxR family transcriptional regulator [Actinocrispum wychmicini]TCO62486.1 regulatory LuxR family protein [Actinocrispum wychmicini]
MSHLVGRAEELAVIHDLLGRPGLRLAEIVGEPGIGKTRLLAEIRTLAEGGGHRVLAGQAGELAGSIPFAVLVDAVDDVLAGGRPPLSDTTLALLADILPAVEEFAPPEHTVGGERFRVHGALSELLEWLATPGGLVLTLDDVHWADEATSELLGRLLRQPPRQPILIVLAYRPRQQPRHLAAALASGRSEMIELSPLSRDQTAELLGPGVSYHRLTKLYALSGGNPLYLAALSKVGTLASFDAVLHAELDGLSGQCRVVAHAAAVLDDPFALDVVAHVAELSFIDTRRSLDDLVAYDLIRADGTRWRYRHPLVRRAAYRSASRGWLHGAHARAARALASAPAVMRAPHVMRVAQVGDEEAVELLAEAARQVLGHGPATAAQWLRATLDLLPDNDDRRLGLLGELGNTLALSGSLHESRDVLQAVLHQLPTDEPERRVAAVVSSARVEQLLGRHPEARGLLLAELKRLPETHRREKAVLELEMGSVGLISCDFQIDVAWITDALATARDLGDRALDAGACAVLALAAYGFGKVTAALAWQREGAQLVDELSDDVLATRLDVTATLGWAELYLAQPRAGLRHVDRGLALSARTGQSHQLVYLLTARAMALHLMGDLADASASAAEAVEAAELSASDKLLSAAYTIQAMVATSRRDRDLALRAGRRAARAAERNPDWWSAVAGCALGGARLVNGDIDGCVTDLLRLAGGRDLPLLDPLHRPVFATSLVVAALSQGHLAEARAWIDMMEKAVATSRGGEILRNRTGHIALCHARWHMAAQSPAEAVQWANRAVQAFGEIDHVLQEAESRQVLGAALAATGDTEGAISELTRTAKMYETCHVPGRRDGVYRQLRALGHNVLAPRSAETTSALPQLTAREAEVAQLVAHGMTNREIADRLQLSRRTVETHVTNIRVKLDVSSRAALAATVIRAQGHGVPHVSDT